jgi:hypothetical protein
MITVFESLFHAVAWVRGLPVPTFNCEVLPSFPTTYVNILNDL